MDDVSCILEFEYELGDFESHVSRNPGFVFEGFEFLAREHIKVL